MNIFRTHYPWLAGVSGLLVVSAPMRDISGPALAVAVSRAGGFGFLGPRAALDRMDDDLAEAERILRDHPIASGAAASDGQATTTAGENQQQQRRRLPIGVGYQLWASDVDKAARAVRRFRPAAVWLFAPRDGDREIRRWIKALREADAQAEEEEGAGARQAGQQRTRVWLQVGTVGEAVDSMRPSASEGGASAAAAAAAAAAASPPGSLVPDVLVLQSSDAGGHGRAVDGASLAVLVPSVIAALRAAGLHVPPIVAAGGIVTPGQAAAALALGAQGVAMGSRFLASAEARVAEGYRSAVVAEARYGRGAGSEEEDGRDPTRTVRTQLYNHLRGTTDWPAQWSPRSLVNASWREWEAATKGAGAEVWGAAVPDGEMGTFEGPVFEQLKRKHNEAVKKGDGAWGAREGRTATYVGSGVGLINDVKPAAEIVKETREGVRALVAELANGLRDQ